jgi:hypothetical protein
MTFLFLNVDIENFYIQKRKGTSSKTSLYFHSISLPRVCLCREISLQEKKSDAGVSLISHCRKEKPLHLPEHPFGGYGKASRGCRQVFPYPPKGCSGRCRGVHKRKGREGKPSRMQPEGLAQKKI